MEEQGYKPSSGMAHSHIRCRGLIGHYRRTYGATSRHSKCNLPEKHEDYRDHVTDETVLDRVDQKRKLLPMVESRKLKYFVHIFHATPHLKKVSYWALCQASPDREAKEKNGQMTLWNGPARQYASFSDRRFTGYWDSGGRISHFSTDLHNRP